MRSSVIDVRLWWWSWRPFILPNASKEQVGSDAVWKAARVPRRGQARGTRNRPAVRCDLPALPQSLSPNAQSQFSSLPSPPHTGAPCRPSASAPGEGSPISDSSQTDRASYFHTPTSGRPPPAAFAAHEILQGDRLSGKGTRGLPLEYGEQLLRDGQTSLNTITAPSRPTYGLLFPGSQPPRVSHPSAGWPHHGLAQMIPAIR